MFIILTFLYDTAQLQFEIAFYQQHEHTVTHYFICLFKLGYLLENSTPGDFANIRQSE